MSSVGYGDIASNNGNSYEMATNVMMMCIACIACTKNILYLYYINEQ